MNQPQTPKAVCLVSSMPFRIGSLFLLLVCTGMAWGAEKPLLVDKHRAAGVECVQCHQDKPGVPVPTVVCKSCHANLSEVKTKDGLPNPHTAHKTFSDCASCHHVHKASENQCESCHAFGFETP